MVTTPTFLQCDMPEQVYRPDHTYSPKSKTLSGTTEKSFAEYELCPSTSLKGTDLAGACINPFALYHSDIAHEVWPSTDALPCHKMKKADPSASTEADEWANVKDPNERRKIQNKIAQRRFRKLHSSLPVESKKATKRVHR